MPANRKELFDYLDDLEIPHFTTSHAPIFTVDDGVDIKAAMSREHDGAHTKNLFLKDKSGRLFLICALATTRIQINRLHPILNCKRLSFGKAELLYETLGVHPGSVTLFSILNDQAGLVTLIIDRAIHEHDIVNFHPLKNDATTAISTTDMINFSKSTGHDPIILDFTELNEAQNEH